jgi:16S rRNA (guanine527-N7)-methyltransferase
MQPTRIAELLIPFLDKSHEQLTTADLNHISTYIDILIRWNARINLTAIRDPDEIVTRHFGESLFAARILFPSRKGNYVETAPGSDSSVSSVPSGAKNFALADVGSGAGFPGIPIKLWAPYISLTLIESNRKKTTFLRELTRALTLTDINIQNDRAETLPEAAYDVVTLRAVERFESALLAAARLVAPGGRLALLIGSAQLARAHSLLTVPRLESTSSNLSSSKTTPFSWSDPVPIPISRSRILVIAHHASRR